MSIVFFFYPSKSETLAQHNHLARGITIQHSCDDGRRVYYISTTCEGMYTMEEYRYLLNTAAARWHEKEQDTGVAQHD